MSEQFKDQVKVVREGDPPYTALDGAEGVDICRMLTAAGTTSLGGGFLRFPSNGRLADWTLKYDEFIFVLEGEMTIVSSGEQFSISAGSGCLLRRGTRVTYEGQSGTRSLYVLYPIDWQSNPLT